MIILFGETHRSKLQRPLLDTYCFECKRVTTWDWYKVTEWITAFLVPVLPLKHEHFLLCGACKESLHLQRDEARGVATLAQLSPEDSKSLHDHLVARLEAQQLRDKTDTQREFIKSRLTEGP